MHEFSLATNIIEIISDSARAKEANRVTKVLLEIGELSGVEESALDTALNALIPGTILAGSEIKKVHTSGKAKCISCNTIYPLSDLFEICPKCNGFQKKIISGKEFKVLSIELETD
jgi:hydrogenase nickel incorporation protein HypA/HybF